MLAIDLAPRWFAVFLGTEKTERLPTKWMRLKARSEAEAKSEADVLDRKLDKALFEKRKQAGVPFERDAHYDSWSSKDLGVGARRRPFNSMRGCETAGASASAPLNAPS